MDRIDILFVYIDDDTYASKLDLKEFPAIVLFRNGEPLRFEGHVENEMAVLKVSKNYSRRMELITLQPFKNFLIMSYSLIFSLQPTSTIYCCRERSKKLVLLY